MRLSSIRIRNYRSIVDSSEVRIERLQAFVGENNAGKSNILRATEALLAGGAGGVQESNFFDKNQPIVIAATFADLNEAERKALRPYLLGDKLIIEKHIALQKDEISEKPRIAAEYQAISRSPRLGGYLLKK